MRKRRFGASALPEIDLDARDLEKTTKHTSQTHPARRLVNFALLR
jgi:hypothetical protein